LDAIRIRANNRLPLQYWEKSVFPQLITAKTQNPALLTPNS
jgi:hypothetical protein